jgi:hypothetical protein
MEDLFGDGAYSSVIRGDVAHRTALFAQSFIEGQRNNAGTGAQREDLTFVNVDDRCVIAAQFNVYLSLATGYR